MDYSIQLKHVYKVYPGTVPTYALNVISLDVKRGESISIVGPSGSAKSTLLVRSWCSSSQSRR